MLMKAKDSQVFWLNTFLSLFWVSSVEKLSCFISSFFILWKRVIVSNMFYSWRHRAFKSVVLRGLLRLLLLYRISLDCWGLSMTLLDQSLHCSLTGAESWSFTWLSHLGKSPSILLLLLLLPPLQMPRLAEQRCKKNSAFKMLQFPTVRRPSMVPFQRVNTAVQVQRNYQDLDVNILHTCITGLQGRLPVRHSITNQLPLAVKTDELLIQIEKRSGTFEDCQLEGGRASAEGSRTWFLPLPPLWQSMSLRQWPTMSIEASNRANRAAVLPRDCRSLTSGTWLI